MSRPEVYTIIPAHNRRHYTVRCIELLKQQHYQRLTIVVVDDGSTDGTGSSVQSRWPDVVLLCGDGNLWWTGAMNLGVSWVLARCQPADYVLTMNDDTAVDPDYVSRLVELAVAAGPALVGSVAVDSRHPDLIVDGGPMLRWATAKGWSLNTGRGLSECRNEGVRFVEPTFLPGRGTLIPVACFAQVGLFNERLLPHYGADYEFSLRAARAGYRLLMSYEAPVVSYVEATGISTSLEKPPWSRFARMFFSRRSPACFLYRWRFARLCVPRRLLPLFLVLDTARVIVGGLRDQVRGRNPQWRNRR